jgi:pimeloyl-ACP methyl ester carboxylesterase
MEYALLQPRGLVSLILASTYVDRPMLVADFDRLREELPADVRETLRQHEVEGTINDPAYKQAERVFDQRMPVGKVNLENWDIKARLNEIGVPTLITCGRFDFCTPNQAEIIHNGIQGSELVIFEESSHYAHIEETDGYLAVLNEFLTRIEQQAIPKV